MRQRLKVVILAGGQGTRLSEETDVRPKPMVEIGGKPILWHIMKIYAHHGFRDFIVCLGYKGYLIKEYFANYFLHQADATVDMARNLIEYHASEAEPWRVTMVNTGCGTMTGGRIKRIQRYVGQRPFLMTYGDGLGDIDITALVRHHAKHRKLATVTAVQPAGRFGSVRLGEGSNVTGFEEKPDSEQGWINGGFFVLQPEVFNYIAGDGTVWEKEPLERLAREGQLTAHLHRGFWQPMDTLRDRRELEAMWEQGRAPWNVWDDGVR